ncbi:glycosyltransferase [uncultured Azonexus sp.]|uniref:glycosyltransferase family 2 protein n=1 Tax=uncultured Azonexus sp. TaxID=520307 RepID=UPI00261D85BB|nr:glycosyltransferase [uncultured Azonexus sp.]
MSVTGQGKLVTILVPNYKTPDITKICLRLLRRHTDFSRVHVIVIDNASGDTSLDYLRSLDWIELIERVPEADDNAPLSHSRALDLALAQVTTPYVLSIHTDTFVRRSEWIDVLLAPFAEDERLAGVGSWKLESKTTLQRWGRLFEQGWKLALFRLTGKRSFRAERFDESLHYLRSHCAMYRTDVIRELNTGFSDERKPAGSAMFHKMLEAGYRMKFLDSVELGQYVDHLNHATMILNPELGTSATNIRRGGARLKDKLRGIDAEAILADASMDR